MFDRFLFQQFMKNVDLSLDFDARLHFCTLNSNQYRVVAQEVQSRNKKQSAIGATVSINQLVTIINTKW